MGLNGPMARNLERMGYDLKYVKLKNIGATSVELDMKANFLRINVNVQLRYIRKHAIFWKNTKELSVLAIVKTKDGYTVDVVEMQKPRFYLVRKLLFFLILIFCVVCCLLSLVNMLYYLF